MKIICPYKKSNVAIYKYQIFKLTLNVNERDQN